MNLLKKAIKTKFNLFLIMVYVKRSFGDYIVKLMYKYGFYVGKVTSADSFHSKLTKGGTVLKEDELRKITAFLRRTNGNSVLAIFFDTFKFTIPIYSVLMMLQNYKILLIHFIL